MNIMLRLSFVFIASILALQGRLLAYEPTYSWSLSGNFQYPAALPAVGKDTFNASVWEYYGGSLVDASNPWSSRTPQSDALLDKVITNAQTPGMSGFGSTLYDVSPAYLRILKQESIGGAVTVDTGASRALGARWEAPQAGNIQISGALGQPTGGAYLWALDHYTAASNTRTELAAGSVQSGQIDPFQVSSVYVNVGDLICLTIVNDAAKSFNPSSTTMEMTITMRGDSSLVKDFRYPASLPAKSPDSFGHAVWEYYGGTYISDWNSRTPQSVALLNGVVSGSDASGNWSGYNVPTLDRTNYYLRITKTETADGPVLVDGREYRILGTRWIAPIAGTIDIAGTLGPPSFGSYNWALDSYIAGTLHKGIRAGQISFNDADFHFYASNISVSAGDVILLSFAGNPVSSNYGSFRPELTVSYRINPWLPEPFHCDVTTDETIAESAVNRRVMGVGIWKSPKTASDLPLPFSLASVLPNLDETSCRLWEASPNNPPPAVPNPDPTTYVWDGFWPYVVSNDFSQINSFMGGGAIFRYTAEQLDPSWGFPTGQQVYYNSEASNNLYPYQTAARVKTNIIDWIFSNGYNIDSWEVWNEPYAAKNGAWPALDMARYISDVAGYIKPAYPSLKIAATLNDTDETWNGNLLAALGAGTIDAFVFHPYCTPAMWRDPVYGEYWGRVAGADRVRVDRIEPHIQTIASNGLSSKGLIASEWGIVPSSSAFPLTSVDMSAALNVPGMYDVFWKKGFDSAQIFQLWGSPNASYMISYSTATDTSTALLNPTGQVIALYTKYIKGTKLMANTETPTFPYPSSVSPGTVEVPMMLAHAVRDMDAQQTVLIISNRHRSVTSALTARINNTQASLTTCTVVQVTASSPSSTIPVETTYTAPVTYTGPIGARKAVVTLNLPPFSVNAVILK